MTKNEKEIAALGCFYLHEFEESCPDVGIGPSQRMIVDRFCDRLPFEVTDQDRRDIAARLGGWLR